MKTVEKKSFICYNKSTSLKGTKHMSENKKHMTSIGGQAVMEGVMMRGPKEIAVAVRKPDGEIIIDKKPVASILQKYKFLSFSKKSGYRTGKSVSGEKRTY